MTFAAQCRNSVQIPQDAKITAPRSDPAHPLQQPEYPAWSRRKGEEGLTVLDVYVTEEGLVAKAQVRKSSGFPVLDSQAVKNAGDWQFIPGQLDGKPVCMWGRFATNFKLTD
jgi:protein TonB